jgi:aspartate racemase
MAELLESAGADFLVMTCNSAHAFVSSIEDAVSIPLISIIQVTADACIGRRRVGVMATDGCIASQLYQRALDNRGLEYVLPTDDEQRRLSDAIVQIKAGGVAEEPRAAVQLIVDSMRIAGADAVVAGCTEIPLALAGSTQSIAIIDSTRELAKATVSHALTIGARQ